MTDSTDNARGPELKPCPFCGSRGIDRDTYWHRYYCTNCGGKGPAAGNSPKADWSTRADLAPDPQDARVAALVEALRDMRRQFSPYPSEDTERWREEHEACEAADAALAAFDKAGKDE